MKAKTKKKAQKIIIPDEIQKIAGDTIRLCDLTNNTPAMTLILSLALSCQRGELTWLALENIRTAVAHQILEQEKGE